MLSPAPKPSESQPTVPEQMDDVISTGMAKEPSRRYQSTRDLAKAARAALPTPDGTETTVRRRTIRARAGALALQYAARSDRGLVRAENEDSVYAGPRLLAVADGMGSRVASQLVIAALSHLDDEKPGGDMRNKLERAIRDGNTAIADHVAAHRELRGTGTALTAISLRWWREDRVSAHRCVSRLSAPRRRPQSDHQGSDHHGTAIRSKPTDPRSARTDDATADRSRAPDAEDAASATR